MKVRNHIKKLMQIGIKKEKGGTENENQPTSKLWKSIRRKETNAEDIHSREWLSLFRAGTVDCVLWGKKREKMKNNQLEGTKGISPEEDLFDFSYYILLEMRQTLIRYKFCYE